MVKSKTANPTLFNTKQPTMVIATKSISKWRNVILMKSPGPVAAILPILPPRHPAVDRLHPQDHQAEEHLLRLDHPAEEAVRVPLPHLRPPMVVTTVAEISLKDVLRVAPMLILGGF